MSYIKEAHPHCFFKNLKSIVWVYKLNVSRLEEIFNKGGYMANRFSHNIPFTMSMSHDLGIELLYFSYRDNESNIEGSRIVSVIFVNI